MYATQRLRSGLWSKWWRGSVSTSGGVERAAAPPSAAKRLDEALLELHAVASPAVLTPSQSPIKKAVDDMSGEEVNAAALLYYNATPRDMNAALSHWIAASRKGNVNSLFAVALFSLEGKKGEERADGKKAVEILRNPTKGKEMLRVLLRVTTSPWPAYVLGEELTREVLTEVSGASVKRQAILPSRIPVTMRQDARLQEAFTLFQRACANENFEAEGLKALLAPPALVSLAHCYKYGLGTEERPARAQELLTLAARAGDVLAGVELAMDADAAAGVPLSPTGMKWWRIAASGGHPAAMHNIGVRYLTQEEPDHAAALLWFNKAAETGYVRSAVNAAALLASEETVGVTRDLTTACILLQRAEDTVTKALTTTEAGTPAHRMLLRLQDVVQRRLSRMRGEGRGEERGEEDADVVVQLTFNSKAERDAALSTVTADSTDPLNASVSSPAVHLVQSYAAGRLHLDTPPKLLPIKKG
jgi:TPR repeat protein